MSADAWITLLLRLVLFIGCAGLLALLLRRCGFPGGRPAAAVAGGILAGILLGPGVARGVAPEAYDALFIGAQQERKSLQQLDLDHARARAAQAATGTSPEALSDLVERQSEQRAPLLRALDRARERTRVQTAMGMVALVSLAVCLAAWAAPAAPTRVPRSAVAETGVAVAVVLFAAVPTALLLVWVLDRSVARAIAVGAVVAAGSLFAATPLRWMGSAGRDALTRRVGLFAAVAAAAVLAWSIPSARIAFLLVPAAAVGIGTALNLARRPTRRLRRGARAVCLWICLPAASAYLTREVDPSALIASWRPITLVVVATLTAGAGHFIGCYLGLQTFAPDAARQRATSHSVEFIAAGVGLTQLCLGVVLFAALPQAADAIALAIILANALAIEVQASLNRRAIAGLM